LHTDACGSPQKGFPFEVSCPIRAYRLINVAPVRFSQALKRGNASVCS
jgi:hypothetical protein